MAVAIYETDLQDVSAAELTTGWAEMTGRTSGGAATQEDRAYIQGSYSVSQSTGAASGRTVGLQFDYGSNIGWTSGFVFLVWQYWQAPKAIGTWADGGMRFAVGSSVGNVKLWNAQGNDVRRNPYGGFDNVAIDPTYAYDELIGTPVDGNYRIFCSAPYMLLAVSKGNPHCVDAIRYGRGQIRIQYGELGNYGIFPGMASANDVDAARWGLFSYQGGIYLWKGLISLGTDSNVVDFRDGNRSIIVDDCPRAYANFNRIEIRNVSSRVDWININFAAIGTLSKGRFEMIAGAYVNLDSCQFTDMDTFIFLPHASLTNSAIKCQWLRCNTITAPGILLTDSKILTPTVAADTSALVWNANVDLDGKIDRMTFSKGTNAHHAIQLGVSSPVVLTIRGVAFSGFNAANQQNDSVLYLADKGSDQTWTIGCVGCSGTVSYKKARTGDSVNITQGVATTVHVQNIDTGTSIEGARVLVKAAAGGPKPYQVSVGLTRSGTTVTVAHTAHGLSTNDWVVIEGANEGEYNGIWQITYVGVDSYTYQIATTPSSPATGSPTATFAPIHALTNAQGNVSDTRVYSSSQPFTGMVRRGTGTPPYKSMPISGTINSETGASITVGLIPE